MQYSFFYVFIILIIIFNLLNENYIRSIFIILSLFLISSYIYKNKQNFITYLENPGYDDIQKSDKNTLNFKKDNDKYINNLKKFKIYNPDAYNNGIKYNKILQKYIDKLYNGNLKYSGNRIDDLNFYLKLCVNNFQEITINIPPNNLKKALLKQDFSVNKLEKKLHDIINKIYHVNKKAINKIYKFYNNSKNINQYSKLFYPGPEAYNINDEYELY